MAKEKAEKPEGKSGGAKKKMHLHEIRSVQAKDGSVVHHHTYKDHPDAPMSHPERGPMATSSNAEEAGQHVAEQFGMNQAAAPAAGAPEPAAGGEPEPEAAPAAAGMPGA